MFNIAQIYENATQLVLETQKKGFEVANLLLDTQLKIAQSSLAGLSFAAVRIPEPFTPEAETVDKVRDNVEVSLSTADTYVRAALKTTQKHTERTLVKAVESGRKAVKKVADTVAA